MTKEIKWGILAPGNIAHRFARGLSVIPDAELIALGSRSKERADAFADEFDVPRRYGSYEDLVSDPDVDAIYVATLNTFHKDCVNLCLRAGKAVLCEKPFAINASEARAMIACAKECNQFLMEAMWTRFLPVMVKVRELLADGAIGEPRMLTADFGYRKEVNPESRIFNPDLGGGGLLDVGIYTIAMAFMVFGGAPSKITSLANIDESDVDEQVAMLLGYDTGQMALLSCATRTRTTHEARIMGTDGSIFIPSFWQATSATLHAAGKEAEQIEMPFEGGGFEYQAMEVMRCLREGKLESDVLPLSESLSMMETLDSLRAQWGLKYPME